LPGPQGTGGGVRETAGAETEGGEE